MKITKVTTFVLEQELTEKDRFAFSQARVHKRTSFVCRIDTDEGISGWGEAFGPARIHKKIVDAYYAEYLIGKDPFYTRVIWDDLYNMFRDNGQKGVTVEALSAVDIALWDIKGKAAGRPVYQMMGGTPREKVLPYATGMYRRYTKDEIEETTAEAVGYVEAGFKAVKLKIGFGFDYDIRLVRSVRKAVGKDVKIMIDANHAYNATTAIRLGSMLEEKDILWFEEPVPPEDWRGYQEVRSKSRIPISGGEAEFTRYGMYHLIRNRCVDIVQPDCTVTGGLSEFMTISTLCTLENLQCFPHVWGSGIALTTGIHAAFSLPDFPPSLEPADVFLEYDRTRNIFREQLAEGVPEMKDGWIYPPKKPGLGIEINEDLIRRYSVE
ncbi:MAG: D-galactarolactone cycloisomerase [Spirochaetales bacterium]